MNEKVGIIGLWHLGCVLCAAWHKLGHAVIGYEEDASKINKLLEGNPPLYEPDLAETIQEGIKSKSILFTPDIKRLAECDYIFLSFDTPVLDDDSSDTTILEKTVEKLSKVMKNDSVLIVSSQSPVGFCSKMRSLLKIKNPSLELAYSPENLRLGEAIQCYLNPGRIILGTASTESEKKCQALFSRINAEMVCMNLESAEMVKHGINSYLSTSIVFSNQIADICEMTGARISDVIRGMKTDPRIGHKAYLSPGIGFSGGTLGRDLKVLDQINERKGGHATLFGLIHRSNSERKYSIVSRVKHILGSLKKKKIGMLGITYKPGTSTLRRSLPLEITHLLIDEGAIVSVFDPKADYSELEKNPLFNISANIVENADSSDMLILSTEWKEFKVFNWSSVVQKMRQPVFLDTKNFLDRNKMVSSGFQYHSIGESD